MAELEAAVGIELLTLSGAVGDEGGDAEAEAGEVMGELPHPGFAAGGHGDEGIGSDDEDTGSCLRRSGFHGSHEPTKLSRGERVRAGAAPPKA